MNSDKILKIILIALILIAVTLSLANVLFPNPNPAERIGSLSPEFNKGQSIKNIGNPNLIFSVTGFDYTSQEYIGRMNLGEEQRWPRYIIEQQFEKY